MSKFYRFFLVFSIAMGHLFADPPTFDTWNFVLWDYADEVVDVKTAQAHWETLIKFVAKNKIRRVITYIKDPSTYAFFDINQQQGNNYFLYYAKQFVTQFKGQCDLCVFFDRWKFQNPKLAPAVPNDLPSVFPSINTTTFLNLNDKMSWVLGMSQLVNIAEVALDPECDFAPPTPSNPLGAYQLLVNYMNYFRNYHSSEIKNVRIGICYGFDEKPMTFVNLSTLPLPANGDYNLQTYVSNADVNYYYFPTVIDPNWQSHFTAPIVDSVYIEAYDNTIPYNFTLSSTPDIAAQNMLHLDRDEAYKPGTGTITVNANNPKELDGTNTMFTKEVVQSVPVSLQQKDGSYQFAGLVDQVTSDTVMTINSDSQAQGINANFMISESPLKWWYPCIDPSTNPNLLGNICMMFSLENTFFGQNGWTLEAFLQFVNTFYSSGQTSGNPALPIYSEAMTPGDNPEPVFVSLPRNFGVYDFYQIQTNPIYKSLLP